MTASQRDTPSATPTPGPDTGFKGGWRQSMSWLHTWVGLLLSVVLYFMFVTGTAGYANSELDRWMRPELPMADTAQAVPRDANADAVLIERAAAHLRATWPDAKEWWITLPHSARGGEAFNAEAVLPPANGKTENRYEVARLDPAAGRLLSSDVRETGGGTALYVMHFSLHYMPYEVAIYIVGIATLFMLVAIVTGIVVHKKIFSDFFTFRPGKGQRSWLDAHNLSSVLALPFMVVITYSGLIFYTYDYMPSVKAVYYGWGEAGYKAMAKDAGDPYARRHTEPAGRRAPMAPWIAFTQAAHAHWGADAVRYVHVVNPGDANVRVTLERSESGEHGLSSGGGWLTFDGSGRQIDAYAGDSKDAVDGFARVMIALHEGRYAGALLRWLYVITGLMGATMVATGLVLWTRKRRQQLRRDETGEAGLRFVERTNVSIIVGLPIAIAVYFWANRLLPLGMTERAAWEMHALFIAWGLCFAHAAIRPTTRAWIEQFALAGALFALVPLLNMATTQRHLLVTLPAGDWVLVSVDLALLGLGIAFLVSARMLWHRTRMDAPLPRRAATTGPAVP